MRRVSTVDLMLLATVLLWALNFTVTKYALTHGFQPLAYSAIRYGTAAAVLHRVHGTPRGLDADRPARLDAARDRGAVGIWLNQIGYVYCDQADDRLDDGAHPRDHADLRRARRVGARVRAAPGPVLVRGRRLVPRRRARRGRLGQQHLGQRRRRPARRGRRRHVGRVQPDRRAADAPPLAVPDQRDRARRRLDPARRDRVAPARDPELGPVVAGLRLPRLRDRSGRS